MKNRKKLSPLLIATIIIGSVLFIGVVSSYLPTFSYCFNTEVKLVNCIGTPANCVLELNTAEVEKDESDFGGVKLVFRNASADHSAVFDVPASSSKIITIDDIISSPNRVEVVAYYLDEEGLQNICSQSYNYNLSDLSLSETTSVFNFSINETVTLFDYDVLGLGGGPRYGYDRFNMILVWIGVGIILIAGIVTFFLVKRKR